MCKSIITTPRLIIRRFDAKDFHDFSLLIRDKMASAYAVYDTQWPTDDDNLHNILLYFMEDDAWYAVELIQEKRVIGFLVASHTEEETTRDLGYTLHSAYQHRGYAYEASCALIAYLVKELGINRFTSGTAECNEPSVKLLKKLHFTKTRSVEASFANDAEGKPISFPAGAYEYQCGFTG